MASVSMPLKIHPACLIYQVVLAFLLMFFLPIDNDFLFWWDCVLKTKNGSVLLTLFFIGIGIGFWASWRLLTNCLATRGEDHSIWTNTWWWLFLFSVPLFLFFSAFYLLGMELGKSFPLLNQIVPPLFTTGFCGFFVVGSLSGKHLPAPKGMVVNEDGQMFIPFSAFAKPAKNPTPTIAPGTVKSSGSITPLLGAIITGDSTPVRTALQEHPELLNTAYAQTGNTPLHVAALNGKTEIVKLLLAQPGIDKTIKNNNGKTAADLAQEKGFTEIAGLLRNK